MATTYLLRNIPPALLAQAKHRAIDEGLTLRQLIIKAIQAYLS